MKSALIVIGAGASKDIYQYFPSGIELIKEINYHIISDQKYPSVSGEGKYLSSLINELFRVINGINGKDISIFKQHLWDYVLKYEHEYLRYDFSKIISIDEFIHDNTENKVLDDKSRKIAQFAISFLLIGYEEAFKEILQKSACQDNWIKQLWNKLKGYDFKDISQNIKIISFNYERTFEFLSGNYIREYFPKITEADISSFNKSIKYIYGSLGNLDVVEYGLKNDSSEKMKTVYSNFQLLDIDRSPVEFGNNPFFDFILFVGFGYNSRNLENIGISKYRDACKVGTGKGLDALFIQRIEQDFNIKINCESCSNIISQYMGF